MTNRKAEWTQTYPKKKWTQGDKTNSNEPDLPSQVPLFNAEEIYSALEVVRKVMKTDAAQPFNGPVDPIALGIPDYFEVIDKPMDFGTICKNLENGVKYKNSKDVLNDVRCIWVNCSKYYKKGHYLLELMKRMRNKFNEYWAEAGLFIEQPQEMDDSAILDRMEQTLRGSTHVQWGSVGPYQRQDQMKNHSRPEPLQPQKPPMQRPYQDNMSSSTHQTPHPHGDENGKCSDGLGEFHLGFSIKTDTEPGRCQRKDGKKWRCSRDICPDQKYCERHMNRGRRRSRMSVKEGVLSLPFVGSMMRCGNHGPSSINFQPHQLPEALLTRVQLTSGQPQPSHIQICSDEEEEHLCSQSRVCSSIRCSKHAPKLREGQVNAIDKHDDMLASCKIVSPRPLTSFGQTHQTPRETLQVQLSSGHPQSGIDKEEEHSHSTPVASPLNATDNHLDQALPRQIVHLDPSSNNGAPLQHPEGISQFHFGQPSRPRVGIDDGRVDVRLVKEKAPHHTCGLNPQRKHNKKWHQPQLCVQTPPQQEALQSLAIENNKFTQIMGQDSPPGLDVPGQTEAEALKMVSTANAEIKEMKEKLASTEQTCAQMATQMATMMSIISDMQKKLSDQNCVPPVPSQAADVSNDSCEHQTAFVHGISSNQAADISNDSGLPSV